MTETVLLPVKNHPPWSRAVAETVTNVEGDDIEALVLHAFEEPEEASTRANLNDPGELSLDDLSARKNGVTAAVDTLEDAGIEATPVGARVEESVSRTILDVRDRVAADRLYLYGRRRNPTGKAVFGSVVQEVILETSVPVTIVPPPTGT